MARFLVLERPLPVGGEGVSDMWAGVWGALTSARSRKATACAQPTEG